LIDTQVIDTSRPTGLRLDLLADACAERNRWEFSFVVAPLQIGGGTGSPVNPIAIL
jgi:hypothetical protein